MIILVENNDLKLKFNEVNKTLIFTDNKGYSYNISFKEKNIIKKNITTTTSNNNTSTTCTAVTTCQSLQSQLNSLSSKEIHLPAKDFFSNVDYPKPIVDLKSSRIRAIEAFKAAKA